VAQARRLGQMLVDSGVVTEAQLVDALEIQKAKGGQLGRVLVDLGFATQASILQILADQIGIRFVEFKDVHPDANAVAAVPRELAVRYTLMPVGFDAKGRLVVAMADPQNVLALDDLRIVTGFDCMPAIATREDITSQIEDSYRVAAHVTDDLEEAFSDELAGLAEVTSDAPIVKLVNFMITKAVTERASDIHIEPQDKKLRVRFRTRDVSVGQAGRATEHREDRFRRFAA